MAQDPADETNAKLDRLAAITEALAGTDLIADPLMFENIIDSLPDGLLVVDESGSILLANRQVLLMFGYPRTELIKRQVHILLPPELVEAHEKHLEGYFSDPIARPMGRSATFPGRHRSGRTIHVQISLGPVLSSFGVLTLALVRRVNLGMAGGSAPSP